MMSLLYFDKLIADDQKDGLKQIPCVQHFDEEMHVPTTYTYDCAYLFNFSVYHFVFLLTMCINFQALANATIKLARAQVVLNETEAALERELQKEAKSVPKTKIQK